MFLYEDKASNDDINNQQNSLKDNLADLFTKALPTPIFEKLKHTLKCNNSDNSTDVLMKWSRNTAFFFLDYSFFHWVFLTRFLMKQLLKYIK